MHGVKREASQHRNSHERCQYPSQPKKPPTQVVVVCRTQSQVRHEQTPQVLIQIDVELIFYSHFPVLNSTVSVCPSRPVSHAGKTLSLTIRPSTSSGQATGRVYIPLHGAKF
jgi:hypothetical protein